MVIAPNNIKKGTETIVAPKSVTLLQWPSTSPKNSDQLHTRKY